MSFLLRGRGDNFELRSVSLRIVSLFALLAVLPSKAQEEPTRYDGGLEFKVAVVDIQALFKDYRKTLLAEREIDLARAEIQKKSQLRTNEIRLQQSMLEKRIFKIRKGEASEEEIADFKRELPILNRELKIAEKEKEKELHLANQRLNQQMVRRMAGILDEIIELAAKKAEAEGFDLVYDSSGRNSSQVAPLLFAKNGVDLTAMMKKELGKTKDSNR